MENIKVSDFKKTMALGNVDYNSTDWMIKALMEKIDEEDHTHLRKKYFPTKQEELERKNKLKTAAIASALAGATILGSVGIASKIENSSSAISPNPAPEETIIDKTPNKNDLNTPSYVTFTPTLPEYAKNFENPIYIDTWSEDGQEYWFCSEEFALELARQSMQIIADKMEGCGSMGEKNGPFYADFFDEYFLAGNAYAESSLRICKTNGEHMKSKDNACGMTQITEDAINTLNKWLPETMDIHDTTYSMDDLLDPEKAMEISTLYYYYICKNHCREDCNNPVYKWMGEEFSKSRQQEISTAIYNNGIGKIKEYINNGTIEDYLSNGSSMNHANRVNREEERLRQKYQANEMD